MKKIKIYSVLILTIGILLTSLSFTSYSSASSLATLTTHAPINLFSNSELDAFCSGDGTDGLSWETAHVIENYEIDGGGTTYPINIESTDRYLIIRGCSVSNSHEHHPLIHIYCCDNVKVEECVSTSNSYMGVGMRRCTNSIIYNNTATEVISGYGFLDSSNCTISYNTAEDVSRGVFVENGDNCTISNNFIENTVGNGIALDVESEYNSVYDNCMKNIGGNPISDMGQNNIIGENKCQGIPGYSIPIIIVGLVGTTTILIILIKKKIKK